MSNMNYCKFRNTLGDLKDCEEDIFEECKGSEDEEKARKRLIKLCKTIAEKAEDYDE